MAGVTAGFFVSFFVQLAATSLVLQSPQIQRQVVVWEISASHLLASTGIQDVSFAAVQRAIGPWRIALLVIAILGLPLLIGTIANVSQEIRWILFFTALPLYSVMGIQLHWVNQLHAKLKTESGLPWTQDAAKAKSDLACLDHAASLLAKRPADYTDADFAIARRLGPENPRLRAHPAPLDRCRSKRLGCGARDLRGLGSRSWTPGRNPHGTLPPRGDTLADRTSGER